MAEWTSAAEAVLGITIAVKSFMLRTLIRTYRVSISMMHPSSSVASATRLHSVLDPFRTLPSKHSTFASCLRSETPTRVPYAFRANLRLNNGVEFRGDTCSARLVAARGSRGVTSMIGADDDCTKRSITKQESVVTLLGAAFKFLERTAVSRVISSRCRSLDDKLPY